MNPKPRSLSRTFLFIAACLLFAGACYQWPLFSSNQNTYFVPGLADAGYGHLSDDWLAQQSDIVPVFSAVVRVIHAYASDVIFYGLFILLAALYAACLSQISATPHAKKDAWSGRNVAVFLLLLTGLHFAADLPPLGGAAGSVASPIQWLGELSISGVAGQDILGHCLQPSAFGVFLLASVVLFVKDRPYLAAACAVFGATFHTSLTLHAGFLTIAYLTALLCEKRLGEAVKTGFVALGLVLPMTIYLAVRFVFSDDEAARAAGHVISADVRQPHHAKPELWFNAGAMIQIAIVIAGLALSFRNQRLFIVLLVCTLLAGGVTLLQVVTGDLGIALLFPWRTSVWLIPASTAVVLGYGCIGINRVLDRLAEKRSPALIARGVMTTAAVGLLGLSAIGIQRTASNVLEDRARNDYTTFARAHAQPGQAYLVPVHLKDFRLQTGLPTYVDWKSFPYRSSEILVWHDRIENANALYAAVDSAAAAAALDAIRQDQAITHIVVTPDHQGLLETLDGQTVYQDGGYSIVEIAKNPGESAEVDHALDGDA